MKTRINRRSALAGFMALALSLLTARPARAAESLRIIVIGAGLSGLSAARHLSDLGHAVIVLEGRDRIGGRIHTTRPWSGFPVELGAGWIHGSGRNPVLALARETNQTPVIFDEEERVIGPAQRNEEWDDGIGAELLSEALSEAEEVDQDLSIMEALLSSTTWEEASGAERALIMRHLRTEVEIAYGGTASELSAWYGQDGGAFPGPDLWAPRGLDRLVTHLAQGLDIRLGQTVSAIAPGAVTLTDGTRHSADQILCTVPLGVLRTGGLSFDAPLDPALHAAIHGLGMGLVEKTWLRFDKVGWPPEADWFATAEAGDFAAWAAFARVSGVPVIAGFSVGENAKALADMPERDAVAMAGEALRDLFGSRFPRPTAGIVTRWAIDPYARGSYSFNAVGRGPRERRALSRPQWDGALWFTGEAASLEHYGTMHGAVMAGRQAAGAMT
jgi:monoamine oxidase